MEKWQLLGAAKLDDDDTDDTDEDEEDGGQLGEDERLASESLDEEDSKGSGVDEDGSSSDELETVVVEKGNPGRGTPAPANASWFDSPGTIALGRAREAEEDENAAQQQNAEDAARRQHEEDAARRQTTQAEEDALEEAAEGRRKAELSVTTHTFFCPGTPAQPCGKSLKAASGSFTRHVSCASQPACPIKLALESTLGIGVKITGPLVGCHHHHHHLWSAPPCPYDPMGASHSRKLKRSG
jgi:hypothetical protein